MHEHAVARDIVRRACAEAEAAGASRVTTMSIALGPDGAFEAAALEFAIHAAGEHTIADGAALEVERVGSGGVVLRSLDLDLPPKRSHETTSDEDER